MEQPEHDLRPFQSSMVQSTERRGVSIVVVGLIHVAAIYALATGLASQLVQKGLDEIKAEVVQEKPPDTPKTPPPPPPELQKPPPPFVPPPELNLQTPAPAQTITQVTTVTPPPPVTPKPVATPPPISAPASIGRAHECGSRYYPPLAVRLNHEGVTTIGFTITPNGDVTNVHVVESSGHDELDQASIPCAQRWQYKPATQNGQPVAVPWTTKVVWKLTGQ